MNAPQNLRYGALPEEWDTFAALVVPVLPVVSNPNAATSPDSKIPPENRGKVPSRFNSHRQVVGIPSWTSKALNVSQLDKQKADPDLGFCVVLGHGTVAIDVDVSDAAFAAEIHAAIVESLGDVPVRRRANSAKFLVPVKVPGAIAKQIITTAAGKIELLGHGQQFVACGTHPSGVRYEWEWPGDKPALPELTREKWQALVDALAERFAVKPVTGSGTVAASPVAQTAATMSETDLGSAAAEVKALLARYALPSDEGCRDAWLRAGMAAHHHTSGSEEGFLVWHAWSATQPGYAGEDDCRGRWDSFGKRTNGAAPVTIASLEAAMRAQRGYTADELGFAPVPEAERTKPGWADWLPGSDAAQARTAIFGDAAAGSRYPKRERLSDVPIIDGNGNFVDGLCNLAELFQVIGAPGGRKSQATGWLAYCVATGREWLGRKTAHGGVLYIAAERKAEQVKRMRVWAAADGLDGTTLPLHVMGPGGMLTDKGFADHICAEVRGLAEQTGQRVVLIVVDTALATLAGADVNASGPASLFAHNLKMIAAQTGAAVAAVHHTPKSGNATGMGSQAFDATFDAVLLIEPTTAGGRVEQVKGNTVTTWIPPLEWTGEPLTVEIDGRTFHAWRPSGQARAASPKAAGMRKQVRDAWRSLCDLSPEGAPVAADAWFAAFAALAWPVDPPKLDSQKRTFREVARQLVDQGKALKAGDDAWRPAGATRASDPGELFAEAGS